MNAVKTALVTGSTDGLGRMVARALAREGYRVWVHGRDAARGETLVREIADQGGEARFVRADFASLVAVRALAERALAELPRLTLLINNAAIGPSTPGRAGRELSADGYELRLAVNYLAGFLLTRRLLPALQCGAPARIVNVASLGQFPLDFENLMLERAYSGVRAYAQSKLAQVMFSFDLAEALRTHGVTVNCLHPATYMDTTMVRAMAVKPQSTVAAGAAAVLRLACAPELARMSGEFFDGSRPARAHAQAYDPQACGRLAALSERLTGLAPEGSA
jgi:NAD(P)-dependent dehydrogenase (short-subunit alcohol dehydrogenase family)